MADDRNDRKKKRRSRFREQLTDQLLLSNYDLPSPDVVGDLQGNLESAFDGVRPNPRKIEEALSGVEIPEVGTLDVEATRVHPGAAADREAFDAVVTAGEGAVDVTVDFGQNVSSVLVESGGDVVEVAVKGGEASAEVAAEVAAEALAGALEGI